MGFKYDFQWDWLQTPRPDEYGLPAIAPGQGQGGSSSPNFSARTPESGFQQYNHPNSPPKADRERERAAERTMSPLDQRKTEQRNEHSDGSQQRGAVTSRSAPSAARPVAASSSAQPAQAAAAAPATNSGSAAAQPSQQTSFKRKMSGTGGIGTKHKSKKDVKDGEDN